MDKESITRLITSYIEQANDGLEIENPKCDFKAKWYDLTIPKDINEFVKDTTAIANTFGLDGVIVIGYDPKSKMFHSSVFSDSKLKDSSLIVDLINKRVDRMFEISTYDLQILESNLSVIHIPPSIDKPHVIRNYQTFDRNGNIAKEEQHKIFVRKNTSTHPASKNDLELMFYDRKNIMPDYKLICNSHFSSINLSISSHDDGTRRVVDKIKGSINFIFENIGRRPIAIRQIQISLSLYDNPDERDQLLLSTDSLYQNDAIVIHPNEIKVMNVIFIGGHYNYFSFSDIERNVHELNSAKKHIKASPVRLTLVNGEIITTNLILPQE
jgi:hypothetical protein